MRKLVPSRLAFRSTTEVEEVLRALHETLFCTISYVEHNSPYSLPTGFCVVDKQLVIHGSVKSHFLNALMKAEQVCISTFIFDGLVLASSAFEHSVNYRSTVIFSRAQEISHKAQKVNALKAFTDKYVPDRWPELRPITDGEIDGTKVLAFPIEKASLKQRSGPPAFKKDEWFDKVWTGEVPARLSYSTPIALNEKYKSGELPEHIQKLITT